MVKSATRNERHIVWGEATYSGLYENSQNIIGEKVSRDNIQHYWSKVDILVVTWNEYINNSVGRVSLPERIKIVRK